MTQVMGMVAVMCTDPNCPDNHGAPVMDRPPVKAKKAQRKAQRAARRRNR